MASKIKKNPTEVQSLSVLIEMDEDGYYVATVPSIPSCYTQAKTLPELRKRIKEVIELRLEEIGDIPKLKLVKAEEYEIVNG